MADGDGGERGGGESAFEPLDALEVEVISGFVEQEKVGTGGESANQGEALAPTAGERARDDSRIVKTGLSEQCWDDGFLVCDGRGDLGDGEGGIEFGVLFDVGQTGALAEGDFTGVGVVESGEDFEKSGLTRAVGADEDRALALALTASDMDVNSADTELFRDQEELSRRAIVSYQFSTNEGAVVSARLMYTVAWRWVFSSRSLANDRSALASWFSQVPSRLFSLIFPDNCRICDEPLTGYGRAPVCRKCLESPRPLTAEIFCAKCRFHSNARGADASGLRIWRQGHRRSTRPMRGRYDGRAEDLIPCFNSTMRSLGQILARIWPKRCREAKGRPSFLCYPRTRRMVRGFNQCESLAAELSRHTGLPVLKALKKTRRTEKQSVLAGAKRRRNVRGSFGTADSGAIKGKRLLLLDDVLTTGSTVNAAAAELKKHGAVRVAVLTVARVDRRGRLALLESYELRQKAEETPFS